MKNKNYFNKTMRGLSCLLLCAYISACQHAPSQETEDKNASDLVNRSADVPAPALISQPAIEFIPTATWRQQVTANVRGINEHGMKTASGKAYDIYSMSAAHRFLPLGTWIEVSRSPKNTVLVQIQDRLAANSPVELRLSYLAAQQLRLMPQQTISVNIRARTDL